MLCVRYIEIRFSLNQFCFSVIQYRYTLRYFYTNFGNGSVYLFCEIEGKRHHKAGAEVSEVAGELVVNVFIESLRTAAAALAHIEQKPSNGLSCMPILSRLFISLFLFFLNNVFYLFQVV